MRRRSLAAAGHVDLGHVGRVVGPVRRHGFDEHEQGLPRARLALAGQMFVDPVEHVAEKEPVALVVHLVALDFAVVDLPEAKRSVEARRRHEEPVPRREHDVAVAAIGEDLRQRVGQFSRGEDMDEIPHRTESARGHARQRRKLGQPRRPAVGFHAQLVELAVVRIEKRH